MNQCSTLTKDDVLALLEAMSRHNLSAEIDWVNRTITVLSETQIMARNGKPFTYQNKLFQIKTK